VAVNGVVSPPEAAQISAQDRGFLMGDGVFEVLVAFGGKVLDVERHLERLRRSADAVGIELPTEGAWADAALTFELAALAERVPFPKGYVRVTVSRGEGLGVEPAPQAKPRRVVHVMPAVMPADHLYKDGATLKRTLRSAHAKGPHPKATGSYQATVVALMQARRAGFDDFLWSTADGEITEASASNLFLIARQGDQAEIVTPPEASGLLPGLTRATMLEILNASGIPAREQVVYAEELPRFDEAFLVSTVRGFVPVARIDKHRLHSARDGAVTRQLERLYAAWVTRELRSQAGVAEDATVDWRTGSPGSSAKG
jgi:branched-subunit amino acid aminotransferase/4-amino-4-deoxychorismate lyase